MNIPKIIAEGLGLANKLAGWFKKKGEEEDYAMKMHYKSTKGLQKDKREIEKELDDKYGDK